jgi:hypothetical protein
MNAEGVCSARPRINYHSCVASTLCARAKSNDRFLGFDGYIQDDTRATLLGRIVGIDRPSGVSNDKTQ